MTCVACQKVIADGSKFCPYCGNVQPDSPGAGAGSTAPAGTNPPGVLPPAFGSQPQPPMMSQPGMPRPPAAAGAPASQRATLSMILGIGSIVLSVLGCCCYGVPSLAGGGLGIAAFVMGRNELEDIKGGFASPLGESHANTGKITGLIGMIAGAVGVIGGILIGVFVMSQNGNGF